MTTPHWSLAPVGVVAIARASWRCSGAESRWPIQELAGPVQTVEEDHVRIAEGGGGSLGEVHLDVLLGRRRTRNLVHQHSDLKMS
jgi:hypothetical protein